VSTVTGAPPFTKLLVANRGEIALRVIRACQELGVRTVAVYSEADARAPHVREADEAVCVGPPPSSQSYLLGDRIIEVALRTGAQAIHPGYGFLSERAWFARAVRDAGLVFVGPPAEAIEAMGSKTAARQLAISAGVPVVPGTTEALRDADEAIAVAESFGFPVLLKAAAGGGGKGMRIVRTAAEMQDALASAKRESQNAFGDDACMSRSTSTARVTWRSRFSPTRTATACTWVNASAQCSADTRR
jgi:acetyl-CoA carboxylase biotin carboxylase subunit